MLTVELYSENNLLNFRPDVVALAVIKIIEEGKPGDVWVSEDSQPPYEVEA